MEKKTEKTTLAAFWSDIKKHQKLYFLILPLTFVVSALISLSVPNYYNCTVKLAPEIAGSRGSSSLANLASSFGVNLGNQGVLNQYVALQNVSSIPNVAEYMKGAIEWNDYVDKRKKANQNNNIGNNPTNLERQNSNPQDSSQQDNKKNFIKGKSQDLSDNKVD